MASPNNKSNIFSCILFRVDVFLSLSKENVHSTSAVYVGMTLQILTKVRTHVKRMLLVVELEQISRITSLNLILLQLS